MVELALAFFLRMFLDHHSLFSYVADLPLFYRLPKLITVSLPQRKFLLVSLFGIFDDDSLSWAGPPFLPNSHGPFSYTDFSGPHWPCCP